MTDKECLKRILKYAERFDSDFVWYAEYQGEDFEPVVKLIKKQLKSEVNVNGRN